MSAESVVTPKPPLDLRGSLTRLAPRIRDFFVHVIAQIRILKKAYPGVMHFMIFWGVSLQVIGTIINILNMMLFVPFVITFPRDNWYLGYELVMDIAGLMILVGVGLAAFRRYVLRPKELETHWDDTLALVLLGLIPLIGFFNEATRFVATNPLWASWSPIGNWLASLLRAAGLGVDQAGAVHDALVWTHAGLACLLVGMLPFTKMRHLLYAPLTLLTRDLQRPTSALEKIEDIETTEILGVGKVTEFTSHQLLSFDACLRCGRCEEACPANASGMPYSPKLLIQTLRKTMNDSFINGERKADTEILGEAINEEFPWYCTTCGACLVKCPAFINPVDEVIDLRRYQILTSGKMPKSVGDTLRNLERQGNPWGMPPDNRMSWADGLDIRELGPGEQTDVLFFAGCAAAFDERNKKVARAFAKLLQKAGVDFAVLGFDETCCGETARRMGHEYIFQEFAKQNIETFGKVKFNRIVTACPHCFNTLKHEYPQMGGDYEVLHYTQLVNELAAAGKLALEPQSKIENQKSKITFHDSCYLGRYNDIYAAPRQLLDQTGVTRVEMARNNENSFCCGGGGGGMWLETDANTRINHERLKDALDAGADVVATACPYCLLMFDDAIRSKGLGEKVKVLDIAEVLAAQMDGK